MDHDGSTLARRKGLRFPEVFRRLALGGYEEDLADVLGRETLGQSAHQSAPNAASLTLGSDRHLRELEPVGGMEALDVADNEADVGSVRDRGQAARRERALTNRVMGGRTTRERSSWRRLGEIEL